jgi:hypothetical protein
MKKILYLIAVAFSLTFTACDPVEDFTENTAENFTADQIDATLEQETRHCLLQVSVQNGQSNCWPIILRFVIWIFVN